MIKKKLKPLKAIKPNTLISAEWLANHRYDDIVLALKDQTELSNRDLYLYSYALLQIGNHVEALIALWPLLEKGDALLREDCASIAALVFNEESNLFSMTLSDSELYTLFLIAKQYIPQSEHYFSLRKRCCDALFQNGQYEKLERLLKSSKKESPDIVLENLAKLSCFQPGYKLSGNVAGFIGLVLTGGACLIARHPMYHPYIENEINALAQEIKLLLIQLNLKNKHSFQIDTDVFDGFIDYEASILTYVLKLAIDAGASSLTIIPIIPTPSYLITHDASSGQVFETFLPWLATESPHLLKLFNAETHQAVLWTLGGGKWSSLMSILKSTQAQSFDPFLRLALMFRAEIIKQSSLNPLVQPSDFEIPLETSGYFKSVLIHTIHSIVSAPSKIKCPPTAMTMLLQYYSVIQDPDLKVLILNSTLGGFYQQYKNNHSLQLRAMRGVAALLQDSELEEQMNVLSLRQEECSQFLLTINDQPLSKKPLKTEIDLRKHLTLISDSCLLLPDEVGLDLFFYIEELTNNKALNKLIPMGDCCKISFGCPCPGCGQQLFQTDVPAFAKALKLPVARLPEAPALSHLDTKKITSILDQEDPFQILGVSTTDTKPVIMQKVMTLIQQSPEKMAIYRQAQNELFSPAHRFLHHYLRYLSYDEKGVEKKCDSSLLPDRMSVQDIPLRQAYINAN